MAKNASLPSSRVSRRDFLFAAAAGSGALVGASMTSAPAYASNKIPQKAVSYQPTPKGDQRCDNCALGNLNLPCSQLARAGKSGSVQEFTVLAELGYERRSVHRDHEVEDVICRPEKRNLAGLAEIRDEPMLIGTERHPLVLAFCRNDGL